MGARGPQPVPNEVLRKRGTRGNNARVNRGPAKDTVAKLPAGRVPEKPLRTLGKEGRATWDRTRAAGVSWLAETDIEVLQATCESIDLYVAMQTKARLGKYDSLDPVDFKRQMDVLRDLRKQVTDGLARLGFTPADRSSLGVAEVREMDDLEKFKAGVA